MCGISVLFDRYAAPGAETALATMHAPIRHRGPDGEGFALIDAAGAARLVPARRPGGPEAGGMAVGLAARRLKIIDLSEAGAQPMASPDGKHWLVYNGEIYNHRALREELRGLGRVFQGASDSEVALAAYEAWGERAFERLDGMWALVIVDLRRRRLVVSRDRFGIKPLYWACDGRRLYLASEIRQILAARAARPAANAPLVRAYLEGARMPCLDETFFEGIRAVPPASWFEVPLDAEPIPPPRFALYWDLAAFSCPEPERPRVSYPEAVDSLAALLGESVDSHRIADVTVGSLLSGGLDSSILTSLLMERARADGRECPTFSFGLGPGFPEIDEFPYAEALVAAERLVNHRTTLDARWLIAHARDGIRTLEEPPLALAALAQYRVFELCRAHGATVVLDGEASDEIFGGYPYQRRLVLTDRLRRGCVRPFARELGAAARREGRSPWSLLADHFVAPIGRRLRPRRRWLAPGWGARADRGEIEAALADRGHDPAALNRQLYAALKWGNMKIVLPYTDKNAMAHSVEARVPYLDRRVVEFAMSLPDHYKIGEGDLKRVLRDVGRRRLPRAITERRIRMGFATPDAQVFRGPSWPTLRAVLADPAFLGSPCFERAGAASLVADFERGRHDDVRAIWRLYALATWCDVFGVALA
jgi:asparagine synthase (glutamine-hydrolysing)